ncbi:MerR family transcriptional regulator [Clostridium sp. CCUG 7971]|uniref:MerR family transcriptional regulator n=1 Tax=Clostridium sp. CCUG 7971 TaxID=2811414 RepID=UPI001ABADE96|nr:MerR family transcriptional regulator [Clostridium sp. CCUG 7971]MBO3445760.1 MerR family transcriptional regulator [Clostridium sp. CCUG 7971]
MLINEICEETGLTKKAINYYEKHGLINPKKDSNSYREYTDEDVKLLNEISLYRKIDIPIKDIKSILNSDDKKYVLNKILLEKKKKEVNLKIQKSYLKKLIDSNLREDEIHTLNEEIIKNEKNNGEYIKNEVKRAFPSGLGIFLSYHFSPYLNGPMDTLEKYKAWDNIVEFLDNVPDIKIPKFIQTGYESISEEMKIDIAIGTRNKILSILNAQGEELEEYKKEIIESIEKQNNKSTTKFMNPYLKFKKQINEFFNSSGYYEVFIPNMKILSDEYRDYHEKLIELNNKLSKELGIKYDENMKIVKIKK